jgi:putative glycerol-1-phosphate prenyltransferase
MTGVFKQLLETQRRRGGLFFLLLDPDRQSGKHNLILAENARDFGVDAILVGSSLVLSPHYAESAELIKRCASVPVIIFPGSSGQVSAQADAVLFTSLISGRNPNFLIDEQVKAAPLIKHYGLEAIPTGYMLIESGALTSVQYVSGSLPIPRHKHDIACAHALAAQYLGMKLVYLEAGSGALAPVPSEMVRAIVAYVDIPVIVGGGLTTPQDCALRIGAGAAGVVVGTRMEQDFDSGLLREMTAAVHAREPIPV